MAKLTSFTKSSVRLYIGDSLSVLKLRASNSIDAVVTDPPYGLAFMGKKWDYDVPSVELWREVLRVLKPGGHVLSFGGTRTYHRMVVNMEDAGFEIRDQIMWIYGSGFPKSMDVSKAIDKAAGAEREVIGINPSSRPNSKKQNMRGFDNRDGAPDETAGVQSITAPATDLAKQWQGWGTALKPANEPIVLARKPLIGTVAANVERFGTGALNIDASRLSAEGYSQGGQNKSIAFGMNGLTEKQPRNDGSQGRWPANVLFDEEAATVLGEPSRFFYVAKASKKERGDGNIHPTVKPVKLMEYLVRLITPPGGTVLDPFLGSGTTGVAAKSLGFNFVGVELSEEYFKIAKTRVTNTTSGGLNVGR